MFNDGMLPVVYNTCEPAAGWCRGGTNVCYFQTDTARPGMQRKHWALQMNIQFKYDNDQVFIAMAVPYSTDDLRSDLEALTSDPRRAEIVQLSTLCLSLGGLPVPLVTVTDPNEAATATATPSADRKLVVISARVHPGTSTCIWATECSFGQQRV